VPQQDAVAPIGALLPGAAEDATEGTANARPPASAGKIDVTDFLISPLANTLLGPATAPTQAARALPLALFPAAAVQFVSLGSEEDCELPAPGSPSQRRQPDPSAALALAIALATFSLAAQTYRNRNAPSGVGRGQDPCEFDTKEQLTGR
jgi:hypothetical protein